MCHGSLRSFSERVAQRPSTTARYYGVGSSISFSTMPHLLSCCFFLSSATCQFILALGTSSGKMLLIKVLATKSMCSRTIVALSFQPRTSIAGKNTSAAQTLMRRIQGKSTTLNTTFFVARSMTCKHMACYVNVIGDVTGDVRRLRLTTNSRRLSCQESRSRGRMM